MTLSLRRAGLALIVVASLSFRAAAQSDAAFASSLSEAPAGLTAAAKLKAKPQKPAAPEVKGPSAPDAVWQKVLEALKTDGKYTPQAGQMPASFSLEDVVGDAKADHTVHNIIVLGLLNEEEQFQAMGAMLIITEFKLDAKSGNWNVEQWGFETDIYGQVADIGQGTVVKTPDGKVLSTSHATIDPADPKIKTKYDSVLKHWAERTPKGA